MSSSVTGGMLGVGSLEAARVDCNDRLRQQCRHCLQLDELTIKIAPTPMGPTARDKQEVNDPLASFSSPLPRTHNDQQTTLPSSS